MNVPVISQKPELFNGCEVTSLAMLLRYAGVNVGKLELAKRLEKDGDPLERFMERYLPGKTLNMTGSSFDNVLQQLLRKAGSRLDDRPLWPPKQVGILDARKPKD